MSSLPGMRRVAAGPCRRAPRAPAHRPCTAGRRPSRRAAGRPRPAPAPRRRTARAGISWSTSVCAYSARASGGACSTGTFASRARSRMLQRHQVGALGHDPRRGHRRLVVLQRHRVVASGSSRPGRPWAPRPACGGWPSRACAARIRPLTSALPSTSLYLLLHFLRAHAQRAHAASGAAAARRPARRRPARRTAGRGRRAAAAPPSASAAGSGIASSLGVVHATGGAGSRRRRRRARSASRQALSVSTSCWPGEHAAQARCSGLSLPKLGASGSSVKFQPPASRPPASGDGDHRRRTAAAARPACAASAPAGARASASVCVTWRDVEAQAVGEQLRSQRDDVGRRRRRSARRRRRGRRGGRGRANARPGLLDAPCPGGVAWRVAGGPVRCRPWSVRLVGRALPWWGRGART